MTLATRRRVAYRAVVVDEAQDMHPEELKLIRQIVPEGRNDLFLVAGVCGHCHGIPDLYQQCLKTRGKMGRYYTKQLKGGYQITM